MFAKPQAEHAWLQKLVGDWNTEGECQMGPDKPTMKTTGYASASSLGGLWILVESGGKSPEGDDWKCLMTLGYDPEKQRYIGTFVGGMMTHMWHYEGTVDASGRRLVLDTEGPNFDEGGTSPYQDIVEWVDDDHWILKSQIKTADGNWKPFMESHHRRKK